MRIFKNHFPGVATVKDRHGRLRYRLRRTVKGRRIDCYLPGPIGSAEFRRAYEEAIEGARSPTTRSSPGTVAYLVEAYLASAAYRSLAASTRADTRGRLDWIRDAIAAARYAAMEPRHVAALMEKKGGPAAANRLRKDLGQLYRFAAKNLGYHGPNPAALADPHKTKRGGYHTWEDSEIETFRGGIRDRQQAETGFRAPPLHRGVSAGCGGVHPPEYPRRPHLVSTGQDRAGGQPADPAGVAEGASLPAGVADDDSGTRRRSEGIFDRELRQPVPTLV